MPGDPQPSSVYDAIGGEPTFRRIAGRFYELVAEDEILRPLYPQGDLGPAEERMRLFLIQQWGGPGDYSAMRGPPKLGARHLKFRIARPQRDAWLNAMSIAFDDAEVDPAYRAQMWPALENLAWNMTTHSPPGGFPKS